MTSRDDAPAAPTGALDTPRRRVILFFYNRFFDPLIQGNLWVFLEDFAANHPGTEFHIVTYEDDSLPLTEYETAKVADLQRHGIRWTPLKWHRGSGIASKVADIASGFVAVLRLRLAGFRHLLAYNSVAGSFCFMYARLLGLTLFLYTYEPHSEYSVDNQMLSASSLQFRVLHWLEERAARFAKVITSGTIFMQERLTMDWKVSGRFFKIPSVTDTRKFAFDARVRQEVRSDLGLAEDALVLFYPGKFGSLYYREEIAWMFRWLLDEEPKLHFLILSPQPAAEIAALFAEAGVPSTAYTVGHSAYESVQRYFWAADMGVIAVPQGRSKKFVSNIKVGEYLCAGLPFLITRGVSEDFLVAEAEGVGTVVDDFSRASIKSAWPSIRGFLTMDPQARRTTCTRVGRAYRGFESLNPTFRQAMQHFLAG